MCASLIADVGNWLGNKTKTREGGVFVLDTKIPITWECACDSWRFRFDDTGSLSSPACLIPHQWGTLQRKIGDLALAEQSRSLPVAAFPPLWRVGAHLLGWIPSSTSTLSLIQVRIKCLHVWHTWFPKRCLVSQVFQVLSTNQIISLVPLNCENLQAYTSELHVATGCYHFAYPLH